MNPDVRILVFTGDGKGKTTAALGMALRAAGHGLPVAVIQFVKADRTVGEIQGLTRLPGVSIVQAGRGFLPKAGDPAMFPHGRGPQGDVIRIYNYVRLVRGGLN